MPPKIKFLSLVFTVFGLMAVAGMVVLLYTNRSMERERQSEHSRLVEKNKEIKDKYDGLITKLAALHKQNRRLKKYLDLYENNFIELNDAARDCNRSQSMKSIHIPEELSGESLKIRQIYGQMLNEKQRWDQYQLEQYHDILETTLEPVVVESQALELTNPDNMDHFQDLEKALRLHRRLIRDVRLFHDEIKFKKQQHRAENEYDLFDLKYELAPFARESALVDAMQQAMSALSAGIYQEEALEVLDRIGNEFTKPIHQIHEQEITGSPLSAPYDYNLYAVFGRKLMEYSDTLSRQSAIELGPFAFGELDFFNRRLTESLYDLYLIGQDEEFEFDNLDLEELERLINTWY